MKKFSSMIGYFLVLVFFYIAVSSTDNPSLFLNAHGLFIVMGGLVVASLASFPWSVLADSFTCVVKNLQSKQRVSIQSAEKLVEMSNLFQKNKTNFESSLDSVQDLFLKNSMTLVLEGLDRETINEILEKRIDEHRTYIHTQMNVMLTLSKYSPAMGLAATVLGLVDLLGKLSSADLGSLGLGMAIALSATFYGIIMSNLVFAPLSELIATSGEFEVKEMEMIRHGVYAMLERKNPIVVGEIVNSFLPMDKQVDFSSKLQVSA